MIKDCRNEILEDQKLYLVTTSRGEILLGKFHQKTFGFQIGRNTFRADNFSKIEKIDITSIEMQNQENNISRFDW